MLLHRTEQIPEHGRKSYLSYRKGLKENVRKIAKKSTIENYKNVFHQQFFSSAKSTFSTKIHKP